MDSVDREIAWIAVSQELTDATNIQRLLMQYRELGQRGLFAEFLVQYNLVMPFEAAEIKTEATRRAEERRRRLDYALNEYQKLGLTVDAPPPDTDMSLEGAALYSAPLPVATTPDAATISGDTEVIVEDGDTETDDPRKKDTVRLMMDSSAALMATNAPLRAAQARTAREAALASANAASIEQPYKAPYFAFGLTLGIMLAAAAFFLLGIIKTIF
ncbi:MAG: hypothetical protein ABIH86_00210 [Planctomycetota bacterium]